MTLLWDWAGMVPDWLEDAHTTSSGGAEEELPPICCRLGDKARAGMETP